jgi:hypothetical protein
VGATISAVKFRAVTLGLDLPAREVVAAPFDEAARFSNTRIVPSAGTGAMGIVAGGQ